MDAIEILVDEHNYILRMIEVVRVIFEEEDNQHLNTEEVDKLIDFVCNFADKYHHLKEEDELFQQMQNFGMPRSEGPLGVMFHEHNEGRKYIRQATEALQEYKFGNKIIYNHLRTNMLSYCDLLSVHIHKENNILYPMAIRLLPAEVVDQLSDSFARSLTSTTGNEYYDKYQKMVTSFTSKYLNQ